MRHTLFCSFLLSLAVLPAKAQTDTLMTQQLHGMTARVTNKSLRP